MPKLPKPNKANPALTQAPTKAPPESGAFAVERAAVSGLDVGLRLVVAVLGSGAVGFFADKWLGSLPWLMMLGGVLGFGGWMVSVAKR